MDTDHLTSATAADKWSRSQILHYLWQWRWLWYTDSLVTFSSYYVLQLTGRGDILILTLALEVGFGTTPSCLHNILWIWLDSYNKFSWIYNWDIIMSWLDFCDLDLIFKITAVENLKIYSWGTSVFSDTVTRFFFGFFFSFFSKESHLLYFIHHENVPI